MLLYVRFSCPHMMIPKLVLNLVQFKWYPVFIPIFFPSSSFSISFTVCFLMLLGKCAAQMSRANPCLSNTQEKSNDSVVSVKHNYKPNVFYLIDSILVEILTWPMCDDFIKISLSDQCFSPCVCTFSKDLMYARMHPMIFSFVQIDCTAGDIYSHPHRFGIATKCFREIH